MTTIELDGNSEATNTTKSVFGSVCSISVINSFLVDFSLCSILLGTMGNGDLEAVTTNRLGLSVLVNSVDGEGELAERSLISISTSDDDGGGRRSLDVFSLTVVGGQDDNVVVARSVGIVLHRVGTIVVVGDVRSNRAGTVDLNLRVAINDWGVVLVIEVDGEVSGFVIETIGKASALNEGVAGRGLWVSLDVEGGSLDVGSFTSDGDGVVARVRRGPGTVVGTVAIVMDGLGGDLAVGAFDVDVEDKSTIGDGITVLVAGGDSEGSLLVNLEGLATLDTRTGGGTVACHDARLDENGLGEIVDGLVVDGSNDVVVAGIRREVVDIISTIAIVLDRGINGSLGALDLNIDVVSTLTDGFTMLVTSGDGEVGGLGVDVLAIVNTRTSSSGASGINGGLDANVEGGALNVSTIFGDGDVVGSLLTRSVLDRVGAVAIVVGVRGNVARGASDDDLKVSTTFGHLVAMLVTRGDGEVGGHISVRAVEAGSFGGGVTSRNSLFDDGVGRGVLDILELNSLRKVGMVNIGLGGELDGHGVLASLGGGVGGVVSTVVVVMDVDLDVGGASDGGLPVVAASGERGILVVAGMDDKVSRDIGMTGVETLTFDEGEVGIGDTTQVGGTGGLFIGPVAELSDVSHEGKLITMFDHVFSIHQTRDLIDLERALHGLVDIMEGVASPGVLGVGARFERIGKSRHDGSINPGGLEVTGLNDTIGADLVLDPFEKEPLGGAFSDTLVDLITENEGPDETEDNLEISAIDILSTDVDELETFTLDEFKSAVKVLHALELHAGSLSVLDILVRDNFQELAQNETILKIGSKIVDLDQTIRKMRVAPTGEGTGLNTNPPFILVDLSIRTERTTSLNFSHV